MSSLQNVFAKYADIYGHLSLIIFLGEEDVQNVRNDISIYAINIETSQSCREKSLTSFS